uniref:Putative salivary serpin n=1 Tax=Corethrella appendiculata TaxID=1370023 RepID=U5EU26_9DIPT
MGTKLALCIFTFCSFTNIINGQIDYNRQYGRNGQQHRTNIGYSQNNSPYQFEDYFQRKQNEFPSLSQSNDQLNSRFASEGENLRNQAQPESQIDDQRIRFPNNQAQPLPLDNRPQYKLSDSDQIKLSQTTSMFALDLFKTSLPKNSIKNHVISPISPQLLLTNLIPAAADDTLEELKGVTYIGDNNPGLFPLYEKVLTSRNSENKVDLATTYFVAEDYRLNDTFVKNSERNGISIQKLDFRNANDAARIANNWVSQKTRGTINQILDPNNHIEGTRLLLANAIYFRGIWKNKFNATGNGEFMVTPNEPKQVSYMTARAKMHYGEEELTRKLKALWVEVPYTGGDDVSMLIIKPSKPHQLDKLIEKFDYNHLSSIYEKMDDFVSHKVNLKLPKFTIKSSTSLVEPLQKIGLKSLFQYAKLPWLGNENTKVSNIVQQAYYSVNEEGTIASGATTVQIITLSIHPQITNVDFEVNEPFLSIIVDRKNKIPLFVSKITTPQYS